MKHECVSSIIDKQITKTAISVHKKFDEMELSDFFHRFMAIMALKIYEAAPTCEDAEALIQDAVQNAKKIYIEQ
jgi:hypothetical protein